MAEHCMSSKERVKRAFARLVPDRVPVDYLANPGIDARLKSHFGLERSDDEGLRKALGVDIRMVGTPYTGPRLHPEVPNRNVDPCFGIRTRWIEHEAGGYWDYCDFPLADATIDVIREWPMPSPDDYDYRAVAHRANSLREHYTLLGCMPDVINATGMIRSMEQTLVDLATDDEAGLLYIDRRLEILLEVVRRTLEAADGAIDCLWLGDDLGTQIGPLISMSMFKKHIRPRHQPFVDLAREWGIDAMMHSCGSSSWAFDDFAEMGVTVVDTLQPEAANMAPEYLKQKFGDRLAFHGCISTAGPVSFGTVDEVVADCKKVLEVMMPGGGYCFCPTHSLQDNSPTENVVAMYETARVYGSYE